MSRKNLLSRVVAMQAANIMAKMRKIKYAVFSNNIVIGKALHPQPVLALGTGSIKVGLNSRIGYYPAPHFFSTYAHLEARTEKALIEIGDNTQINNGFTAIAERSSIVIGNNCLIGTQCEIYDSDFHALSKSARDSGHVSQCSSVVIEDDVFIGSNVRILKGVKIGFGAVIGNSSVVTRDVPPQSVASGAPAVFRRRLN